MALSFQYQYQILFRHCGVKFLIKYRCIILNKCFALTSPIFIVYNRFHQIQIIFLQHLFFISNISNVNPIVIHYWYIGILVYNNYWLIGIVPEECFTCDVLGPNITNITLFATEVYITIKYIVCQGNIISM